MIDIFHVRTFTVRKAASLITADIYIPSIDKKGSMKTTTSGLKIDSLLVASSNLKLTRATKS